MKTIILCGGKGSRIKDETDYKPKPMINIGPMPILWHLMKIYAYWGFNDFILALGYKADYIKDYFLNQKAYTTDFYLQTKDHKIKYYLNNRKSFDDFKITFVDTGEDTLIGERILKCEKYVPKTDKQFMVTYGDAVVNLDLRDLYKFHLKQKKIGTITGVHPRSKFGLIQMGRGNTSIIKNVVEKPDLNDWVNGGFMVFNRSFFKYLKPNEMEHPALNRLAEINQLSLYKHLGFWYAVDTFKEYEELNKIWSSGKAEWKVW